MRMTRDGKRLFISMNTAGKIVMFDTSNPRQPKVLKFWTWGQLWSHYIGVTDDEERLVISDYFLNEDEARQSPRQRLGRSAVVHVAGVTDRTSSRFSFPTRLQHSLHNRPARPHGMAFK